jgi:argininosuccinate synthase
MKIKKVVLAYSGGLDTTYCALYLSRVMGYEVHAACVQTGGFSGEELREIEKRAYSLGIASFTVLEETCRYYDKVVRYLLYGNVLKNQSYPLSVSAERIAQAVALAAFAREKEADAVAHGSTGAGNDQVRFDMVFQTLLPEAEIITPIRDQRLSREEELLFLKKHGVEMTAEKAAYSINKGLWGTSVGGRETLGSKLPLPEHAWPVQVSKTEPEEITLTFEKGEITAIDARRFSHPSEAIQQLHDMAAPFGIGRDVHTGDTILGIKGRVGFEAAAPLILIKAHHLLEKHVLGKWQLSWKEQLASFYGNWLHEGMYLDPVMRDLEAFLTSSQRNVSGEVYVRLLPYRFELLGIASPHDLMSSRFGVYGESNLAWTAEDVKGFTRIFGNQNALFYQINQLKNPYTDEN